MDFSLKNSEPSSKYIAAALEILDKPYNPQSFLCRECTQEVKNIECTMRYNSVNPCQYLHKGQLCQRHNLPTSDTHSCCHASIRYYSDHCYDLKRRKDRSPDRKKSFLDDSGDTRNYRSRHRERSRSPISRRDRSRDRVPSSAPAPTPIPDTKNVSQQVPTIPPPPVLQNTDALPKITHQYMDELITTSLGVMKEFISVLNKYISMKTDEVIYSGNYSGPSSG